MPSVSFKTITKAAIKRAGQFVPLFAYVPFAASADLFAVLELDLAEHRNLQCTLTGVSVKGELTLDLFAGQHLHCAGRAQGVALLADILDLKLRDGSVHDDLQPILAIVVRDLELDVPFEEHRVHSALPCTDTYHQCHTPSYSRGGRFSAAAPIIYMTEIYILSHIAIISNPRGKVNAIRALLLKK